MRARKKFAKEYLKYEKRTKRWVRLTNEEVERLENDETNPLLPGVGQRVSETHVEFHIDCHPSFRLMEPTLSARNPPGVRELIIYGQDETVFKQNTYSSKEWVDSKGATSLLPKSYGLSIMVSGYECDKFVLVVRLSDAQLDEVNERRGVGEFSHYISTESALELFGNTNKKNTYL